MGFAQENQLWKLRHKPGRKLKFETATALITAAEEYFEWSEANPLVKVEYTGNPVRKVKIPTPRPFTLSGLCLYLHVNPTYWRQLRASQKDNEAMRNAIARIDAIIYIQKFEGACAGIFNANLISRDLKLGGKQTVNQPTNRRISAEPVRVVAPAA